MRILRTFRVAGFIRLTAFTIVLFGGAQQASAQGTDLERQACTPDVFRLCGAYIPDADRIVACLRANGPRLSRGCYAVFFPPQLTETQDIPPRRTSRYPQRRTPAYEDDY
jgi:hypothetical protein